MQLLIRLILTVFIFSIAALRLSAQSLGSSADYNISPQDSSTGRSMFVDVHKVTGKIVYIWNDLDSVGTTRDIYCAIYKNDMTPLVSRFRINKNSGNEQIYAKVKVNQQDSTFVVAWASNHSGSYDVFVKKISLNTASTNYANVKTASESLVNNITAGDQNVPFLTFDYFKNELIVGFRDQNGTDGSSTGAFARRFNYGAFTTINNQFQINNYSTGAQHLNSIDISPVTGELITLCQSNSAAETSNYNVIKRIFTYNSVTNNYDGQTETVVNSYTTGGQINPWLVINSNTGDYLAAWTDDTQDLSGYGVYSKIFNKLHTQTIADFRVSNATANNQLTLRPVWDIFTNNIVYFFLYSVSNLSTLQYRIFTYNDQANTITAVNSTDQSALWNGSSDINTYNYYASNFSTVYNPVNQKLYIAYDRYRYNVSYNSTQSNGKARVFIYSNPSISAITDYISYAELKTDLDGGYYTSIGNKFYFKYIEKYNQGASPGTVLNYKIFDYKRNVLGTASLNKVYGVNYYSVDLRGIASLNTNNQNYYTLEVYNDKGEKSILRFKYIPEY
ncbi:MAG TPA: hypothetical protein VNW99_03930 [Cytophagaceae bacterium]|jgi:hypothetical protein|nr:hypothetical protein [Cytophagaceae bacterium]